MRRIQPTEGHKTKRVHRIAVISIGPLSLLPFMHHACAVTELTKSFPYMSSSPVSFLRVICEVGAQDETFALVLSSGDLSYSEVDDANVSGDGHG